MDSTLDDSLTLEGMDFDHSVDVVNQEDIPLEDGGRLDTISMDMDDIGEQSHALMESVNDEVIVSDLIEEPFPFQEYDSLKGNRVASCSNMMIKPSQLHQLVVQHNAGSNMTLRKGPAATNVVTLKVAQPKAQKRLIASAPPRQVAIAPKPTQTNAVQYAIAPKPVALVANKPTAAPVKKVPITSESGKGSAVLAQIGRKLVMVPKKIKLMSSTSAEGVISSTPSGLQYQVACTAEQAQQIQMSNANRGPKPMVKFIHLPQGQSIEQATNSGILTKLVPANTPKARYVMQQKTVPISIGGNKVVQNLKIAGKKQIIAIKSQSPKVMPVSQGNVATKKVLISSNPSQKILIRKTAPTTQGTKDAGSTGQRTQFHPINVPGKGIQYIKLVTNQPPQKPSHKPVAFPSKNFVLTDSKGNVIQMTAEKVVGQPSSGVQPGISGSKGVVKGQKKLVRIAPISKTVTQPISQPARSSQSLLAPITTVAVSTTTPMTSLPSIGSPVPLADTEAVSIEDFNEMVEQNEKMQQSYSEKLVSQYTVGNYMDKSIDSNEYSNVTEEYSTVNEYSTEDASTLHEETVEEVDETIDVKPSLQSLISEAVSEIDRDMESFQEIEEPDQKSDFINHSSFMHKDDSNLDHDSSTSRINEESIIIVPGSNYSEKQNESMYSDQSRSYHNRRMSMEDRRNIPQLSVEAECVPYNDNIMPESPTQSDPDAPANLDLRPRKACNCTKSQCLKLYCDCFANGEFCNNCNCNNCHNNLENEEIRQKAIRSCLERNPNAFRPKIGKSKAGGPEIIRRHTKGCNCKRSGCLKNYCECFEAKIACTAMCKCVGCRNVEEILVRRRDAIRLREKLNDSTYRPSPPVIGPVKQPCSFVTTEVIEAVCQCLIATAGAIEAQREEADPVQEVIEEFARCLQDVISASHNSF